MRRQPQRFCYWTVSSDCQISYNSGTCIWQLFCNSCPLLIVLKQASQRSILVSFLCLSLKKYNTVHFAVSVSKRSVTLIRYRAESPTSENWTSDYDAIPRSCFQQPVFSAHANILFLLLHFVQLNATWIEPVFCAALFCFCCRLVWQISLFYEALRLAMVAFVIRNPIAKNVPGRTRLTFWFAVCLGTVCVSILSYNGKKHVAVNDEKVAHCCFIAIVVPKRYLQKLIE